MHAGVAACAFVGVHQYPVGSIHVQSLHCSVRIHFCTSVAHNAFVQIGQCTCAEICLFQCAGSCEA